jgi:5-methylcytosine-specific restriction endonuclease McrA
MIPVTRAAEPTSFDAKIRRRGLDAIAELVGESRSRIRRGPKRKRTYASRNRIPAAAFPEFWRDALPDLHKAYGSVCAYLGLYLYGATSNASVDHFVPKSRDWRLVYEWSNFRLCSSLINVHKGDREILLDPFAIEPGLFALELTDFQVKPGPAARGPTWDIVANTIVDLGLNQRECCKEREEYVKAYCDGELASAWLESHAPFIAHELRRQGLLVRGDT